MPLKPTTKRERALLLGTIPAERTRELIAKLADYDILLLALTGNGSSWLPGTGVDKDKLTDTLTHLGQQPFDAVIIPYDGRLYWQDQNLITLTMSLAPKTIILFADGRMRTYCGEDVHRLQYNSAYLNQLFKFVPPLSGQRLLDVGCSDGLVCDLMLNEEPEGITGIDMLADVGHNYPHPRITYFNMDAAHMRFEDNSFELSYCIAVLEHVNDPLTVLREVKRVTRPGGYAYIQAGPLYCSPFGHHMFGHFDDYPWIHLRLSKSQIATYAREQHIAARIQQATNRTVEAYLEGIFNPNHLNGRRLSDYHLDQFMADPAIEVLSFSKSYEGESLLTPEVRQELSAYTTADLITHGFELVFRVK